MADEPELAAEESAEETSETWVSDGELWIPDPAALCAEFGILAIATYEGNPVAYVRGKGAVSLHELTKAKRGKFEAIKGGRDATR